MHIFNRVRWSNIKGQIIKSLSGFYYVYAENHIYQTRGRGQFREQKVTPLVGDWVEFQFTNDKEGLLLQIYNRKNELIRPAVSNIDLAIIVMSVVEPSLSQNLLDRYIIILENLNITPIIYLSKCDISYNNDINQLANYYQHIGYTVILSNDNLALERLKKVLYNKLSVLMGQTGAGKTTLLNTLLPDLKLKTGEISNYLNRGKHTTRHVEIHTVDGCFIVDTPGFSALDFFGIEVMRLSNLFVDLFNVSQHCRFRGCQHINEPNCAVKEYATQNIQFNHRYYNYLKFHQEMSNKRPVYQKNKKRK